MNCDADRVTASEVAAERVQMRLRLKRIVFQGAQYPPYGFPQIRMCLEELLGLTPETVRNEERAGHPLLS